MQYRNIDFQVNLPELAIEHPQQEIENTITAAGLLPDGNSVTQLSEAVQILAGNATAGLAKDDLSNVDLTALTLDGSQIDAGTVTETALADNAVTLDKLAHGTPGKVIGFDANGEPAEVEPGIFLQRQFYMPANFSTTSETWVDAGTVSFTPKSANSTLYVQLNCVGRLKHDSATQANWYAYAYIRMTDGAGTALTGAADTGVLHFEGVTRGDGAGGYLAAGYGNTSTFSNTDLTQKTFKLQTHKSSGDAVILENITVMIDEIAN